MAYARVTLTFPPELVEKIDKRAYELGLNRSGFIALCVSKQFEFDKMMELLPTLMAQQKALEEVKKAVPENKN